MSRRWLLVGVVGVLALAGGAIAGERFVSSGVDSSPPPPAASPPSPPSTAPAPRPPRGFVSFRDQEGGFSLSYPESWRRLEPRDPRVRLLATAKDNTASVLVRVAPLDLEVPPGQLPARERFTQQVLRSGNDVKLLAPPRQAQLGGRPGYSYLYTFKDSDTGVRGAHFRYFLFERNTVTTLVLQVVPAQRLSRLTPLLAKIANSFAPRA